jgi:hypothetical protein
MKLTLEIPIYYMYCSKLPQFSPGDIHAAGYSSDIECKCFGVTVVLYLYTSNILFEFLTGNVVHVFHQRLLKR